MMSIQGVTLLGLMGSLIMSGKERGFTYLALLFAIVLVGISLSATGQYWSTILKREKEAELLFRGDEIKDAIGEYYRSHKRYPDKLEYLLRDPYELGVKRYLRKIYPDPMSRDGKWVLTMDRFQRIKGVRSQSEEIPLKKSGFPREYRHFSTAKTYSDWQFICNP